MFFSAHGGLILPALRSRREASIVFIIIGFIMRILIMLSLLAIYLASDFWGGCFSYFSRRYSFSEELEESP